MAQGLVEEQNLKNIAIAIREKNGEDALYTPAKMSEKIQELIVLDTFDADAKAGEISKNKVAYVKGEKITGTLEKREEEVISNGITPPTTRMANNNIEFLYELRNPEQIILQDSVIRIVLRQSDLADIIGLTANVLKKDVEILGVTGTYTGE